MRKLLVPIAVIIALSFAFTVFAEERPAAPKGLDVLSMQGNAAKVTVKLTWKKAEASKYYVYVSSKPNSGFKLEAVRKGRSFKKKYRKGKTLFFRVKAVKGDLKSRYSAYAAVKPGKVEYNCYNISIDSISSKFTVGKTGNVEASADGSVTKKLGLRFNSNRPSVAEVVKTGKFSAKIKSKKAGKVIVTVSAPNGMSVSKIVTITEKKEPKKTLVEEGEKKVTRKVVKKEAGTSKDGSKTPSKVNIPDVVGMEYREAMGLLKDTGLASLTTKTICTAEVFAKHSKGKPSGTVLSQKLVSDDGKTEVEAKPGTEVEWGTRIYLETVIKK